MSITLAPGTTLINEQYTLTSKLGEGGMASVWAATKNATHQEVVLKILLHTIQRDEDRREMFLEEANLSSQLHHPNIVEIYGVERWLNLDIILMERIWGHSLNKLLLQTNRTKQFVPWPIAVKLITLACKALHYANVTAHVADQPLKLIHRDIKPANLILTTDGTLKVIDFGIAKATTSQIKTRTGLVKGTVAYMSPEQLHADPLDIRSDLYSLGVVLYQLCTGHRPFKGESIAALILKILGESPPPMLEKAPHLPTALIRLVEQLLEKDKERRPLTALALQLSLEELLRKHNQPIHQAELQEYARQQFPDLFREWEARFPEWASSHETVPEIPTLRGSERPQEHYDSEDTLPQRPHASPPAGLSQSVQEKLAQIPAFAPTINPDDTPLDVGSFGQESALPKPDTHAQGRAKTLHSSNTLAAPPGPTAQSSNPSKTLAEDAVPQFFRVDGRLANSPLHTNTTSPPEAETSRWVNEHESVWEDDDEDETIYQRSSVADQAKIPEATTLKSPPPKADKDTTLREKAKIPAPTHHAPEIRLPAALANLPADGVIHASSLLKEEHKPERSESVPPTSPQKRSRTFLLRIAATLTGLGLAALLWWWFH